MIEPLIRMLSLDEITTRKGWSSPQQQQREPVSADLDIADDDRVHVTLSGRQLRELAALGYRIRVVR